MKKNMGATDKTIRIILAAIFVALYFTGSVSGLFGYVLLGLALIFVLTSVVSFCPIYTVIGVSSCPANDRKL